MDMATPVIQFSPRFRSSLLRLCYLLCSCSLLVLDGHWLEQQGLGLARNRWLLSEQLKLSIRHQALRQFDHLILNWKVDEASSMARANKNKSSDTSDQVVTNFNRHCYYHQANIPLWETTFSIYTTNFQLSIPMTMLNYHWNRILPQPLHLVFEQAITLSPTSNSLPNLVYETRTPFVSPPD